MENEMKSEYQEKDFANKGNESQPDPGMSGSKGKGFDYYHYRNKKRSKNNFIGGFILIVLGGLFLADNLIPGFRFGDYWPLILIAIGLGLIFGAFDNN